MYIQLTGCICTHGAAVAGPWLARETTDPAGWRPAGSALSSDQWLVKPTVVVSSMPLSWAVCDPGDSPSSDGLIM